MSAPKTIVFGFDAMDFRFLDRFADETPTISRLRRDGVSASLESTFPPWTGSAWPSMYTGTDPSHHGVYDFFASDGYPDDATVVSRNDVDAPALWNYLDAAGVPSIVLNVPVTHPPDPIDGVVVPGYLAPDDAAGHPEGIRSELSEAIGRPYRIYADAETTTDTAAKYEEFRDLIARRTEAATYLLDTYDWELAVLQLQKTDAAFHAFDDEDRFRGIYAAADEFAAAVLDVVEEPVNVVVCSDHGMGRKRGYAVYVNEILREHGFVTAGSGAGAPSLPDAKQDLVGGSSPDDDTDGRSRSLRDRAIAASMSALDSVGVSPGDVYVAARRVGVADRLADAVPTTIKSSAGSSVDWRRSVAYCRSAPRLGVRINLAGREPDGVVPPEQYERVRSEIIDLLSEVEDPDGRPAFEAVRPREAVYDGPHADAADDVLVSPRDMDNTISTKLVGRQMVPVDVHDHTFDGVFVGHGPGFTDRADLGSLSLTDVAPIVMALLDRPVPRRMTGSVPDGLLETDVGRDTYGDVPFGTDRSERPDETDDAVTERLEDLGYL